MDPIRYRMFVAHPRGVDDELPALVEQLRTTLQVMGVSSSIELVTGRDDYESNFARYGGWEGWAQSVATGGEYFGGMLVPRFNSICVAPSRSIGRGTKAIVEQALSIRKDVFFFDPKNTTYPITRVSRVMWNGGDWQNGWLLQ